MTRSEAALYVRVHTDPIFTLVDPCFMPIIKAYSEGHIIERYVRENGLGWVPVSGINFTDGLNIQNYRIKPTPKYIPFTYETIVNHIGRTIRLRHPRREDHGDFSFEEARIYAADKEVFYVEKANELRTSYTYRFALEELIFACTGEPCGEKA